MKLCHLNSVRFTLLNQVSRLLIVVVHFWLSRCFGWHYFTSCETKWSFSSHFFLFSVVWLLWCSLAMLIESWLAFLFLCSKSAVLWFCDCCKGQQKLIYIIFLWIEGPIIPLLPLLSSCLSFLFSQAVVLSPDNWDAVLQTRIFLYQTFFVSPALWHRAQKCHSCLAAGSRS